MRQRTEMSKVAFFFFFFFFLLVRLVVVSIAALSDVGVFPKLPGQHSKPRKRRLVVRRLVRSARAVVLLRVLGLEDQQEEVHGLVQRALGVRVVRCVDAEVAVPVAQHENGLPLVRGRLHVQLQQPGAAVVLVAQHTAGARPLDSDAAAAAKVRRVEQRSHDVQDELRVRGTVATALVQALRGQRLQTHHELLAVPASLLHACALRVVLARAVQGRHVPLHTQHAFQAQAAVQNLLHAQAVALAGPVASPLVCVQAWALSLRRLQVENHVAQPLFLRLFLLRRLLLRCCAETAEASTESTKAAGGGGRRLRCLVDGCFKCFLQRVDTRELIEFRVAKLPHLFYDLLHFVELLVQH
eukprot:Rhum_TRINITY_DN11189_c0_g4::Rhum_TRINITY_DN11189_c0_g4_i1::g.42454::m.42454